MAEVIKFPGGRGPRGPDKPKGPDDKGPDARLPSEEEFEKHVTAMHDYIRNLKNPSGGPAITEESVTRRQAGLAENSITELTRIIWDSDFRTWEKNPSFFFAAARTLRAKVRESREKGEGDANRD